MEYSGSLAQPHSATHLTRIVFWHVDNNRIRSICINFCRVGVFPVHHIPGNTKINQDVYRSAEIFLNKSRVQYLVNSITAACNPRHTPRNGFRVVRHHVTAAILPSIPRLPKPPGTITPLKYRY
jgi:hypothetical protein